MNKKGSKHLTIGDRATIESLPDQRKPLLEVAEAMRKDPRSISREVKNRRTGHECLRGGFNGQKDRGDCKTLLRWPYVCNGCPGKARCMFRARYEYSAKDAQSDYEKTLSESRDGLDMAPEDLAYMEGRMRECVSKGRSPMSEFVAHEGEMPCSLRSFYRRVDEGKSTVISLDLIRKVKLRKRRRKAAKAESPNPARKGREYADFLRFLAAHPGIFVAEIDTVESGRGPVVPPHHPFHLRPLHDRHQARVEDGRRGVTGVPLAEGRGRRRGLPEALPRRPHRQRGRASGRPRRRPRP